MGRGRKHKKDPWDGLIPLIVVLCIFGFGEQLKLAFTLGTLAAFIFIVSRIVKATRGSGGQAEKKPPVEVRTRGTYARPNPPPLREDEPVVPKPKPEPVYPPEVQAVVDEGLRAHQEMERLYATIPDLSVKAKIRELIDVSDKITEDAKTDPSDVPQIRKFQDYYLPTTIKLLNAYDRMSAQGIEGEHISGTMQSIEEMLDTAIAAYKKLLDSLFANQALDVETDIRVMNTLLQREGLAGETMPGFGK